jgi:hypothetical protein
LLALYKLRFYALDQPIAVGDDTEFTFFVDPHYSAAPESPISRDMILVFANTLESEGIHTIVRRCAIRSIVHSQLGAVRSITPDGFDYRVELESGEILVVNAEEKPGHLDGTDLAVSDWAFVVDLEPSAA